MKKIELERIKPYRKVSFRNMTFSEIVFHLHRPYIELTQKEYDYIRSLKSDVVEYEGYLYTFGNYDGDKLGLMPYTL